jgi:hypothetical protein
MLSAAIAASSNKYSQQEKPTLRSCVMTKDGSLSCCTKDEGRPLGFGNQVLESNRPMRPLLRVMVVSDREKAE